MSEFIGYYGKLPARGDFVGRRLGPQFVAIWDEWLQQSLQSSRLALGERWLDLYLNSSIWRFYLGAGVCGSTSIAGVMIPSVDSVGRCFPFVIAGPIDNGITPEQVMIGGEDWYTAIEARILLALEPDFELDRLDDALQCAAPQPNEKVTGDWRFDGPDLCFNSREDGRVSRTALEFISQCAPTLAVFWTSGSAHVKPCCLVSRNLPAPGSFASMLDGNWEQHGWVTAALGWNASDPLVHRKE